MYSSTWNRPQRHRGGVKVKFYSFFNLGTRWKWVVNVTPQQLHPQEKDSVPTVQKAGWAPGPVWAGEEFDPCNLIYGLRYPSPYYIVQKT